MSLIDRIATLIADRIHAPHDATAHTQGLTVARLPGNRRQVSHPDLPALLEARRQHALTHGLDPVDRALIGPATRAALRATRAAVTTPVPDRNAA